MLVTQKVNSRNGNAKMIHFLGSRMKICFLTMVIDKKRILCSTRGLAYGAGGRFMEPQMTYALEVMKVRGLEFCSFVSNFSHLLSWNSIK
jgi:hypothetical protein